MSPPEFRAALAALDLPQVEAARLWHMDATAIWRYASGKRPIPAWVPLLLTAWTAHPELLEHLRQPA